MTITQATLVNEEGGIGDKGCNYVQTWLVYFSGGFNTASLTYTAFTDSVFGPLPKRLDTHTTDAAAYVADIKIKLADGEGACGGTSAAGVAEYVVTFAQKDVNFDPNPLSRPAVIEWSGTDLKTVPMKDKNDKPLVNSAGDLYTNLPEVPIRGAADVMIQRNEAANPGSNVTNFSNTINNAAWYGVPSNTAALGKIHGMKKTEVVNGTNLVYWEVTYPISIRKDGWTLKPIDNGYRKLDGSNQATVNDLMGNPTPTPVLLDGSGGVLPATNHTGVIFPTDGYDVRDTADWSVLSLPNPFT